MRPEKIKNIKELETAKKELRENADRQLIYFKESFNMAKKESRKALISNILIPGVVAAGMFFGIRAILKRNRKEKTHHNEHVQTAYVRELKRVDWINIMVKILPLLIGVGRRLYEEDNLPFVRNPHSEENKDI